MTLSHTTDPASVARVDDGASPGSDDVLIVSPNASADEAVASVAEWLDRPALRRLVEEFDGTWPTNSALTEKVDLLVSFSQAWDKRSGASRLDIVDDTNPDLTAHVVQAAAELGLVAAPEPSASTYDWVFILGGLVTGCLSRVEALARLLDKGVQVGGIALLGSFRELHADERDLALTEAGAHASTEVDLLTEFAAKLLPTDGHVEVITTGDPVDAPRLASRHAQLRCQTRAGSTPLHVFASASSDPDVRPANTADTYEQAAGALGLSAGQTLLLVTTRVYRYQHLDAVRALALPYGVGVETYGTGPGHSRRVFGPAWYLQEVRSMLLSCQRLLTAVAASGLPPA